MLLVKFTVVTCVVLGARAATIDTVPVFLIDPNSVTESYNMKLQPNPLAKMSTPEFSDIVHMTAQKSDSVIMFIEQKLCSEDIAIRDRIGTPFFHLHKSLLNGKVKYLPNVVQPFHSLMKIFPPQHYNTFNITFAAKSRLVPKRELKYYYVFFNDSQNKTRAEVLREHDAIIREECLSIQRQFPNPVTAFYTGIANPIESLKIHDSSLYARKLRNIADGLVVSEGALFKFSGVYATSSFRRAAFDHTPDIEEQTWRRNADEDFTRMSTRMSYSDFDLQFNFTLRQYDWTLENVMLLEGGEEVGFTTLRVGLPWGRSYICWRPLIIINRRDASYIVISQYQLEPIKPCKYPEENQDLTHRQNRRSNQSDLSEAGQNYFFICSLDTYRLQMNNEAPVFHAAEHCEPYFTHQIIAGLMISFLLLAILASGIVMLVDCSGNGRYDDPHGKTIIVSTTGGL